MKCEKQFKGEIIDRCQTYDKCDGELVFLMNGFENKSHKETHGVPSMLVKSLYKCSVCGDVALQP